MSAGFTPGPFYLDRVIEGFRTDPPDSDFQDGYMAGLHALKAESGYDAVHEALAALVEKHILRGPFDEPLGASEQSPEINAAVAALTKARGEQ